MKVLHLITGLAIGGAEMMLYKLLASMDRTAFQPIVVSLSNRFELSEQIESLGVPVHIIGMRPGRPTPAAIWRSVHTVVQLNPDLIQGWMYHGNLAAQLAGAFLTERVPVLWNIRASIYSLADRKRSTAAVIKLGALLSHKPKYILYNAQISAIQHEALGYRADKRVVIPNGFDTQVFVPSEQARAEIRRELNLPPLTLLVGLIARYHPMKDHANFLRAAAHLLNSYPDVHFLLAGENVDDANQTLTEFIRHTGIGDNIHLLGKRRDMPRVTAALDIACSASAYGEGFPNVIGEAMACEVPCVVTDVGDSAWIVGETGLVVPPRDAEALMQAWRKSLEMGQKGRIALGRTARERVVSEFCIARVAAQYEALYSQILHLA